MSDNALIEKPNGESVEIPAVPLTTEDVAVVGAYCSWLSRERLIGTLQCVTCGQDAQVEVYVDDTKIGIACPHRMLYYEGLVPVVKTVHPPDPAEELLIARFSVPEVPISHMDAQILRQYKTFLLTYGFKEALHCLQCEEHDRESGMRAYVTASDIGVICRCAIRTRKGSVH